MYEANSSLRTGVFPTEKSWPRSSSIKSSKNSQSPEWSLFGEIHVIKSKKTPQRSLQYLVFSLEMNNLATIVLNLQRIEKNNFNFEKRTLFW